MNTSLWHNTVEKPKFPTLRGQMTVDAAVIGAGMAGVLCARLLTNAGQKVVVLEAGEIGGGVTGNTTAKITAQHGLIYAKLNSRFGALTAERYASAAADAVERFAAMAETVDCDFVRADAYVYARDEKGAGKLEEEREAARAAGLEMTLCDAPSLPFPVMSALRLGHQAAFHPLKFLYGVARGLEIYEHSRVLEVGGRSLTTQYGGVEAKKIVFCTHYPFVNVPGWFFARMFQSRSYVLALEGAAPVDGLYIDCDDSGFSFRPYGGFLLMGGEGHPCGETEGGHYHALESAAARLYPGARIACRWSAQDCMTLDGLPFIGRYGESRPDWLVAAGFAKWGMTGSMAGAVTLSELALGRESLWGEVFDPARSGLSVPGVGQELKGMTEGFVANKAAGRPVCTHLGCSLTRNGDENSWDCPCHGSRFDAAGHVLDGPAQTPLTDFGRPGL